MIGKGYGNRTGREIVQRIHINIKDIYKGKVQNIIYTK